MNDDFVKDRDAEISQLIKELFESVAQHERADEAMLSALYKDAGALWSTVLQAPSTRVLLHAFAHREIGDLPAPICEEMGRSALRAYFVSCAIHGGAEERRAYLRHMFEELKEDPKHPIDAALLVPVIRTVRKAIAAAPRAQAH